MAKKKELQRKIDQKTTFTGAPLPLIQEDEPAPPAFYNIPEPDTLIEVGQAISRSTQAPLVSVALSWQEAPNIAPDYYNVEWDLSSSFTDVERKRASQTSATIDGLKANGVTYYFRVQAVMGGIYSGFSDTLTVVTMDDDTPPPDVTSPSATFVNGDLHITWTKPVSEIYKDVTIKIYNSGHTILYGTFYSSSSQFIWTASQNLAATSNVGLTSVSIDLISRSWFNTDGSTVNITATSVAPSAPVPTFNWTGDTGIASADLLAQWTAIANADSYELTLDGTAYNTRNISYLYRYEQNVAQHTPTLASGDPNITYLLKARNKLNQVSTAASGTVINTAPPSGVMSMIVTPGFSTLGITVSLLGGTIVQDFDHFEYALASGSTTVQRYNSPDNSTIMQLSATGTYTPLVTMVDKFNQRSATISGAPVTLDILTIDELRAETQYTDWLNNSAATLAKLKDGFLYDGSANYVTYAANAGWQWVQSTRPLLDRYKTITFSASWGTAFTFYYQVDTPSGTVYYSGPITISANGSYLMTRYTNSTSAITNAYVFGSPGTGTKRFDFSQIEEARTIRLWFKDTGTSFLLSEYYPRRLVQSDDIEAESIRSINIAALGINADRIFAATLSALAANIGQLTIDTTGYLFQGTGSGTAAQNAGTPTSFSVTGLKIYNSGGVGKISTYNSGTEQITIDTDGKLKWAAGSGIMDASGIKITAGSTLDPIKAYLFKDGSANTLGGLYGYASSGHPSINIQAEPITGKNSSITIVANSPSAKTSTVLLEVDSGLTTMQAFLATTDGSTHTIAINAQTSNGTITLKSPTNFDLAVTMDSTLSVTNTVNSELGYYNRSTNSMYSGDIISLANNAVAAIPIDNQAQFVFLFIHGGGIPAIFSLNGGAHTTQELSDVSAVYSVTAGTASSVNIYWSAGNARYEIENKRGSTLNFRFWWLGCI